MLEMREVPVSGVPLVMIRLFVLSVSMLAVVETIPARVSARGI